MGKDIVI